MMLVHASFIFMNAAAGGRQSCFSGSIHILTELIMPLLCRYFVPCYYLCGMKYVFMLIGSVSLVLGVAGIFLPLLPTTPFLLLAAAMFFRSSPRAYRWLLGHRYLGPYIRSFREDRSIPLRAKIVAHVASLCGADIRLLVAACRHACRCPGRELLYIVVQDAA